MAHVFDGNIEDAADIHNIHIRWHWIMQSLVKLVGPQTVWDVGLKVLEYPPTWVDTHAEADIVESAVFEFLRSRYRV